MSSLYDFYRGPIDPNVALRAWGTDARGVRRSVIFEPGERYSYQLVRKLLGCNPTGVERV